MNENLNAASITQPRRKKTQPAADGPILITMATSVILDGRIYLEGIPRQAPYKEPMRVIVGSASTTRAQH